MRPAFVYKADGQRGRQWTEVFRREAPEIAAPDKYNWETT